MMQLATSLEACALTRLSIIFLPLREIIELDFGFSWNRNINQLLKNNEIIKLSKYERNLFELFLLTNCVSKTYDEIEYNLFNNYEDNTKRLRNLITRLKLKLNCDLFEAVYSFGYTLKYEEEE